MPGTAHARSKLSTPSAHDRGRCISATDACTKLQHIEKTEGHAADRHVAATDAAVIRRGSPNRTPAHHAPLIATCSRAAYFSGIIEE
jgi:hypothetical protein